MTPAPRLSLAEWCNRHRILSPESSPEPGHFSTDRAPYQFEMLDVCGDYRIETVVMMCGAQLGKSTLIENVIASYMAHDPAPMLVVFPELNLGKAFMTERLDPMIRDTPALKGIVKPARSRDSGNTQQKKRFVGGQLNIVGSNAAAGLSSRPIRVLLMDEVDRFAVSAGEEGDPLKLATARTANYWNKKIIMASTPTNKGFSRIEKEFAKSDQRYYEVPCPHCQFYARLRFQKPKDGVVAHWIEWDDNNSDSAHVVCCNCAAVIEETYKRQMLRDGRWVATVTGNSAVGFCISTLYSPWLTWANLAKEWLATHGDIEARKVFINTKLCELWEDYGERVESHHLVARVENYDAEVPTGVGYLVAAVDVQADRIEMTVWGYGEKEESWFIDTQAVYIQPSTVAWHDLTTHLLKKYKTASGIEVGIRAVAIDTGHQADSVGQYIQAASEKYKHIAFFAVKGSSTPNSPIFQRGSVGKVSKVRTMLIGTDTAKDVLFGRLKQTETGAGYIHFPEWVSLETLEQITSEKRVKKYHKGVAHREYVKIRPRNEQLDMMVYALAALRILGIGVYNQLGAMAKKLSGQTEAPSTTEPVVEEVKTDNKPVVSEADQRRIVHLQQRLKQMRPKKGSWNKGWNL